MNTVKRVNFENFCNNTSNDIEELGFKNPIFINKNTLVTEDEEPILKKFVIEFCSDSFKYENKVHKKYLKLRRKYKINPKKAQLSLIYFKLLKKGEIEANDMVEKYCIVKKSRGNNGVYVVSVIMGPGSFSCSKDCHYCPNFPNISRSYIPNEPTVSRGERNNWDPYKQFVERGTTYVVNGHQFDKIELIILGGTFSYYPPKYVKNFIHQLFYAANTFYDKNKREILTFEEEKILNETALAKIIGITIETRPDCITKFELRRFRSLGVTRVQIGIQHTDNKILKLINRESTIEDAKKAIKLMKDACFKIDAHFMPDLPGSSLQQDKDMFDEILDNHELQVDQWKIYPTSITEHTEIKKWYDEGKYKPYCEKNFYDLIELGIYVKEKIHRYIRINRFQRDFPGNFILGGSAKTNLRQLVHNEMKKLGKTCKCIRCQEVKGKKVDMSKVKLTHLKYKGSGEIEYFISFNSGPEKFCWKYFWFSILQFILSLFFINILWYGNGKEDTIYGFIRLRLPNKNVKNITFPELTNCALIRELHVYGKTIATYSNKKASQHRGFGKKLLKQAEFISKKYKFNKIAVISGVGVREYYRKNGYVLNKGKGEFLIKNI